MAVTCYSTKPWRFRRLVRKVGAIHCQRCHEAKKAIIGAQPALVFNAILWGLLNAREVAALFPSGQTCRRYGRLVDATTGEVLR